MHFTQFCGSHMRRKAQSQILFLTLYVHGSFEIFFKFHSLLGVVLETSNTKKIVNVEYIISMLGMAFLVFTQFFGSKKIFLVKST